jgi:hypothetical protein
MRISTASVKLGRQIGITWLRLRPRAVSQYSIVPSTIDRLPRPIRNSATTRGWAAAPSAVPLSAKLCRIL